LAKKKKRVEKPKQALTKHQLSHFKKHQRRQRIIFGAGILIIVAVLVVVGAGVYFGWYVPERQPLHETVIRVNDTEFSMDYYVKAIKYQIPQMERQLALYGLDMDISYVPSLASSLVTSIQTSELVRQEALKLGISVSDEELAAKINEQFASYDPSLLKTYHDVIRDTVRTQMLQDKLLSDYFDQQVPQSAEQRHIMAMFLESQSQANELKGRLEGGELFSELTAEFCLDSYCKSQDGDLGWHPREMLPQLINSPVLVDSAFSAEVGVISQPVYEETKLKALGYWLVEVEFVDAEVEHAQLKVMLLSSEEEANEIRARLEDGEDFAALAAEFSQHADSKENGGEFEIDAKGLFGEAFDEFVFDPELELGSLSQPIKDDTVVTTGGYWLIKVAEAASDRPLDEADRNTLKRSALSQWVEGLPDDPGNTVESYLDEEKTDWAVLHAWEG
jgi:parvulin-like peptidyl-prolyl isomerase